MGIKSYEKQLKIVIKQKMIIINFNYLIVLDLMGKLELFRLSI